MMEIISVYGHNQYDTTVEILTNSKEWENIRPLLQQDSRFDCVAVGRGKILTLDEFPLKIRVELFFGERKNGPQFKLFRMLFEDRIGKFDDASKKF